MIDSDTARAATTSAWMKDWGQFVMLLLALGGFYGFIRSDLREGLAQVRGEVGQLRGEVAQLREGLAEVREGLAQVREDVAHLEGYVRGRLGDEPG
ncbi:MAG: hypothetical protein F4020_04100 [Gammaproteobacteria bacterium]|nr:hypothetical protein [Gammaproteobacteria bacterium]MDE0258730.1 hypothetical protein [Gammaproteobacteria bacterium]MYH51138.1 hypothetical protein [Gammaproteobacteria bacterium]MYK68750.1 hypothetical protein [Gammaproteobacteria bacterium]